MPVSTLSLPLDSREAADSTPRVPDAMAEHLAPSPGFAVDEYAAPQPGQRWHKYEILERLGQGGMGIVYRARDRTLDRLVALKFLRNAEPKLTQRFLQEARAQARINHDSVCRIYEVGEHEGRVYIDMELVSGTPLCEAAAELSLFDKVQVLRGVALGIHEAHRIGVIHRDLKPANIMPVEA